MQQCGWLPFHSLAGEILENYQAPYRVTYSSEFALLWVNQESKKFPFSLLRLLQVLQDLQVCCCVCVWVSTCLGKHNER